MISKSDLDRFAFASLGFLLLSVLCQRVTYIEINLIGLFDDCSNIFLRFSQFQSFALLAYGIHRVFTSSDITK